jgi:3-isopropylmalate dehydrogenase
LRIRKELGLYANIRPANFASETLLDYSPLRPEIAKGFDMIVVRELIGGLCTYTIPPLIRLRPLPFRLKV